MCSLCPIIRITVVRAYWINDLQVQENKKARPVAICFTYKKNCQFTCALSQVQKCRITEQKHGYLAQSTGTYHKARVPTPKLSSPRPCFSKYLVWSIFDLKIFLSYWHVWTSISCNVTLAFWIFGMHVCYLQEHDALVAC